MLHIGYIKEPKGVGFVVEPHVLTDEDRKVISEAIAYYKTHGKFKKAVVPKRKARAAKKKVKK